MKITQSLQPWQEGPPPTAIDAYAPAWTNAVGLGVNDDVWDVTMALMLSPQFMHLWKTSPFLYCTNSRMMLGFYPCV
jgi:hypothetical protein